ncbi:GroES-like protein [Polyplosphaeria fusca]|uniref:GroES-like protein n=1 Tax=Polyplosphaeria fusca TaxID=682080 RepID=A0A9P4QNC1_9PLEO|nr:GroES-like protein [Polyplosphaeria fusca]
MKGATVAKQGGPLEVSTDLEIPQPDDKQILIKSIYAAINPVEKFMVEWGLLVDSWPVVPGCEGSGIVLKVGKDAINPVTGALFKEGDEVCGCTRLGMKGYSPWQEQFLMDAAIAIPKPSNITLPQAATIGSGALTAFMGVFDGLRVPLLDPSHLPSPKNEWALVFGGASSVGKFAVQTLKAAGYKVATTASAKSTSLLQSLGADLVLDYNKPELEIIADLKTATSGKLNLAFDAVSVNNPLATSIFSALAPTTTGQRLYTTTNDWDPVPDASNGFTTKDIKLGPIGRPEAKELNERLSEFIPVIVGLIEGGKVRVGEFEVKGEGVEGLGGAWEWQKEGKGGSRKVLVRIGEV